MPFDHAKFVSQVFKDTGSENPLRSLADIHKRRLVALLQLQLHLTESGTLEVTESFEEIAAIAAQAVVLANRMRTQVFGKQLIESLGAVLGQVQVLPPLLEAFGSQTAWLLNQTGKPGHKDKMLRNSLLVMASELVRDILGSYYDEYVAEAIQSVSCRVGSRPPP